MAEQLTVYEPGDRFATMSRDGVAHVYEVADDGRAYVFATMSRDGVAHVYEVADDGRAYVSGYLPDGQEDPR